MIMYFLQIFHLYYLVWKTLLSILLISRLDFIFNFLSCFPFFHMDTLIFFLLMHTTALFDMSLFKIKLEGGQYKKLS